MLVPVIVFHWGVSKKNNWGVSKRLIGDRCHLGSNRHGQGPLLLGSTDVSAAHQYMGLFLKFFFMKSQFFQETSAMKQGIGVDPILHLENNIFEDRGQKLHF